MSAVIAQLRADNPDWANLTDDQIADNAYQQARQEGLVNNFNEFSKLIKDERVQSPRRAWSGADDFPVDQFIRDNPEFASIRDKNQIAEIVWNDYLKHQTPLPGEQRLSREQFRQRFTGDIRSKKILGTTPLPDDPTPTEEPSWWKTIESGVKALPHSFAGAPAQLYSLFAGGTDATHAYDAWKKGETLEEKRQNLIEHYAKKQFDLTASFGAGLVGSLAAP